MEPQEVKREFILQTSVMSRPAKNWDSDLQGYSTIGRPNSCIIFEINLGQWFQNLKTWRFFEFNMAIRCKRSDITKIQEHGQFKNESDD